MLEQRDKGETVVSANLVPCAKSSFQMESFSEQQPHTSLTEKRFREIQRKISESQKRRWTLRRIMSKLDDLEK